MTYFPRNEPTIAPATVSARQYVAGVDALRGLAVLLVIAVHTRLLPVGWTGVWLFFVISGFAITSSLQSADRAIGNWQALRHFYVRRCLRIWPLYSGFVLANVGVLIFLGRFGPLASLPYLASFTYNFEMIFTSDWSRIDWSPFAILWTLSVEEQFYLIYPVLFLFCARRTTIRALLFVVAGAPLLRALVGYAALRAGWTSQDAYFAVYGFGLAHFDAFAGGALVALFRDEISRAGKDVRRVSIAVAGAGGLYFGVYATLQYRQEGHVSLDMARNIVTGVTIGQGREAFLYSLVWLASACLLMLLLTGQRTIRLACSNPGLRAFGRVSYGIYMFHLAVAMLVGAVFPAFADVKSAALSVRLFDFAIVSFLAYMLAAISFRYVEQPMLRLRRYYS